MLNKQIEVIIKRKRRNIQRNKEEKMWKISDFVLSLIIVLNVCNFIDSACVISATDKLPLFLKSFGTKKIMLPKDFRDIQLDSGEAIEAFCSTGISLRTKNQVYLKAEQGISGIEFHCNNTNLTYTKIGSDEMEQFIEDFPAFISCDKPVQQIYETKDKLPNCDNYSSYAIGIAPTEQPDIVTAGICYDLENLSVKYVTYMARRPKYMFLDQKSNSTSPLPINLETRISGFKELLRFVDHDTFNKSFATKKIKNPLLQLQDYDYTSLIQHPMIREELKDYEHMLDVVWWRNLRLGNWYYFMKALERRAEKVSYTIYTGTSGILSTPITACERYEELAVKADDTLIRAPAYIWTYLKSTHEELVVIGYNSAFLATKSPLFRCKDTCSDYDWISKSIFGRTHAIPTLGLVYCCRVEEVANKLENFPLKVTVKSKVAMANTTNIPDVTTSVKPTSPFKNRNK